MKYFVDKHSIVRRIWGKSDTVLFIFAGAAAEFALNKAVDWLYFTGRLPRDPMGRLFSTVRYAQSIVFAELPQALHTIDTMTKIHEAVEKKRGKRIPDWAYRDVLFMLIDYSIRSFELLERKLTTAEKQEVFQVFHRLGSRMGINDLPSGYEAWLAMRQTHLNQNYERTTFTDDLFKQYRKHLGVMRYKILWEAQLLVMPHKVSELLGGRKKSVLWPLVGFYKLGRNFKADKLLKAIILPTAYKSEIKGLDYTS